MKLLEAIDTRKALADYRINEIKCEKGIYSQSDYRKIRNEILNAESEIDMYINQYIEKPFQNYTWHEHIMSNAELVINPLPMNKIKNDLFIKVLNSKHIKKFLYKTFNQNIYLYNCKIDYWDNVLSQEFGILTLEILENIGDINTKKLIKILKAIYNMI